MRTVPFILLWIVTLFSISIRAEWTDGFRLELIGWWERLFGEDE
jgi:hypothetical protein